MNILKALNLALVIFSFSASAQNTFPKLSATSLEDKILNLPGDAAGKFTIVGMAYSQKAEKDLKTWYQPAYDNFIAKPDPASIIPTDVYDVHVYFIPLITGSAQVAAGKIEKEMKSGIDKELHKHVALFKGNADEIKTQLNMTEKDLPYFFVLDPQGKIVHSTKGAFSEAKMEAIEKFLE